MSTAYFLPRTFRREVYDPEVFFNSFFENFPSLWTRNDNKTQSFLPSLDVISNEQNYTIKADLPGMQKNDVKLEINDGVLTLAGEKSQQKQENEGTNCHLQERCFGAFSRSLTLPDDVDSQHITAQFQDGVLTITLPRKTRSDHQQIAITAA
ncbi:MAG: Hsp20/alpha crystallin family protein [Desulfovibrio sp.]|nr:Hsp20/alpha crystallin family protein [Desulfovibrio sp.]